MPFGPNLAIKAAGAGGKAAAGPVGWASLGLDALPLLQSLFGGGGQKPVIQAQPLDLSGGPSFDFLSALLQDRSLTKRPHPPSFAEEIPSYQGGTDTQPGGPALVGENGPEIAFLQPDTPVLSQELLDLLASASGSPSDPRGTTGQIQPSEPVASVGAQMPEDTSRLGGFARAVGSQPFTPGQGSLGFLTEVLSSALRGRHKAHPNLAGPLFAAILASAGNVAVGRKRAQAGEREAYNQRQREGAKTRTQADILASRSAGTQRAIAARDAARTLAQHRWAEGQLESTRIFPDVVGAKRKLTAGEYSAARGPQGDETQRFGKMTPGEQNAYLRDKGRLSASTREPSKPKEPKPVKEPGPGIGQRPPKTAEELAALIQMAKTPQDRQRSAFYIRQNPKWEEHPDVIQAVADQKKRAGRVPRR